MIFVVLGTQDKKFDRLLKAVEKLNIDEEIVIQAGINEIKTDRKNIKILKFIEQEEFSKYMKEARIIICHAGVGTLVEAVKLNKKVIAAARLTKYGEHVNDHQIQILEAFASKGYILPLNNFEDLEDLLKQEFKPKKFESNNENFIKKLEEKIDKIAQ